MDLTDPANRAVLTRLVRDTIDKAVGDSAYMAAQAGTVLLYQLDQTEPLPVAIVHVDGDAQSESRELQNISGRELVPGDRVAILLVPPHGGFVLSPVTPPPVPAVRLDDTTAFRVATDNVRTPFPFDCLQIETRPDVLVGHLGFVDGWVEVLRTGIYSAAASGVWTWSPVAATNYYLQAMSIDVHDAADNYLRTVARTAAGPFLTTGAAGDWFQMESCATQAFYAEAGQLVRTNFEHVGTPSVLPTIGARFGEKSNMSVVWVTQGDGEECEECEG